MDSSKLTSFIPYLEAKQKARETRSADAPKGGTAFSILPALAAAPNGVMKLSELQSAIGMNFLEFADAVKQLIGLDYLTLTGNPGGESAQISAQGAKVADLARSA
jgi:hypothetical protein